MTAGDVETWSWAWKAETRLTGTTTTLLQNVEILAVDQRVDAPADNKVDPNLRSVTLLVKPKGKAKQRLKSNGQVKLKVKVTFTPTGGLPNTRSKKVRLIEQ